MIKCKSWAILVYDKDGYIDSVLISYDDNEFVMDIIEEYNDQYEKYQTWKSYIFVGRESEEEYAENNLKDLSTKLNLSCNKLLTKMDAMCWLESEESMFISLLQKGKRG